MELAGAGIVLPVVSIVLTALILPLVKYLVSARDKQYDRDQDANKTGHAVLHQHDDEERKKREELEARVQSQAEWIARADERLRGLDDAPRRHELDKLENLIMAMAKEQKEDIVQVNKRLDQLLRLRSGSSTQPAMPAQQAPVPGYPKSGRY